MPHNILVFIKCDILRCTRVEWILLKSTNMINVKDYLVTNKKLPHLNRRVIILPFLNK